MLEQFIKVRSVLPKLGEYTIAEDFAVLLVQEVLKYKPCTIIEAGSGVSTVLLAYCIEKIGYGKIISFEHLEDYATQTKCLLNQHQLNNIDVNILYAPLTFYEFGQYKYRWYDVSSQSIPDKIDMMIVDGPPRPTGYLARYPILPIFYQNLSNNGVILLDDANREDEKIITEKWLEEFPDLTAKKYDTEKGAVRFNKKC